MISAGSDPSDDVPGRSGGAGNGFLGNEAVSLY